MKKTKNKVTKKNTIKIVVGILLFYIVFGILAGFKGKQMWCQNMGYAYCPTTIQNVLTWPYTLYQAMTTPNQATTKGWKVYRSYSNQYSFEYPGDYMLRIGIQPGGGQVIYSPDTVFSPKGKASGGVHLTSAFFKSSDLFPNYLGFDAIKEESLPQLLNLPKDAESAAYVITRNKSILVLVTSKGRKITLWCSQDIERCKSVLTEILPTFRLDP
jgi:hypothetical protein